MSRLIVLYDACVLYSAPLRDLLMQLALSDLFRAKWSHHIHEEWIKTVLKNKPHITREKINHVRDLMDRHVRDSLVENYEEIIPSLHLPDPNDRHVLAAAIKSSTSVIVTYNLKDFPRDALNKYDIEAQHPDDFIMRLFEMKPGVVCTSAKVCRERLKNPEFDIDRYLAILENQSLLKTVNSLRQFRDIL